LDVTAQGYSRWEFSGDDVVAFYTGGVQFDYLGYHLAADELRYNQATKVAEATGHVNLAFDSVNADCDQLTLDGIKGELRIPGALTGFLERPALAFTAAGGALLTFPPGETVEDLAQTRITLSGGVVVTGEHQSRLETDGLVFSGADSQIYTSGAFTLTADFGKPELGDSGTLDLSPITLRGASLTGIVSQDRGITSELITQADVSSPQLKLAGTQIVLRDTAAETGTPHTWEVEGSGNPLSGTLIQPKQTINFTAKTAVSASDAEGLISLNLQGAVEVLVNDMQLSAKQVLIARAKEGYSIAMPSGVSAAFDLSQYSGSSIKLSSNVESLLGK